MLHEEIDLRYYMHLDFNQAHIVLGESGNLGD